MPNLTLPSSRTDFIDPRTGKLSREWYLFFLNLYTGADNGSEAALTVPVNLGITDQISELSKSIETLELVPRYEPDAGSLFTPAGAGGITRTMQTKVRETVSSADYGMIGDGVTVNGASADNFANAIPGWDGFIPAGKYLLNSAGTMQFDYSTGGQFAYDGDPVAAVHGAGPQNTILLPITAAQYAIQATGISTAPVMEVEYKDICFSGRGNINNVNGLYLNVVEIMTLSNLRFEQLDIGIYANSVEFMSFNKCLFERNVNGIVANLGTGGFTHFNAGTLKDCLFDANTANGLWVQDNAATTTITGGSFANNGTMGVAGTAAINMTFSGAEGANGVNISGVYFEANKGTSDINLVNSGSTKIVHIIQGCNFNRVSSTDYTTHNITSTGPNIIILIGCTFHEYGTYVPSAARPYISCTADTTIIPIGCSFSDYTAATHLVSQTSKGPNFVNIVITGGTINPSSIVPLGWNLVYLAVGRYQVTHNLNSSTVITTPTLLDPGYTAIPYIIGITANTVTIGIRDAAGVYVDSSLLLRVDDAAFTS